MKVITGKKIIDLSRIIAGPYASMVLADFGCEVIKVESPQGDPTRQWGPPWFKDDSAYFLSVNRNKKSIALNLKQPKCREVLYKLVEQSDVVLENFIPGTTEKLKIDYDTLKQYNDKLVYCSVTGFGDFGHKKFFPAFDNLIQAQTGFMHLTGNKEGEPFKLGFAIVDVVTSLYAANSILAGLIHRQQFNQGIHMKTSLFECAASSLINQGSNYLNGGMDPIRMGNHHPNIIPYGLYYTKTLPIIICVGTNSQYESLRKFLQIEDLPQFSTNALRLSNRISFDDMLNKRLMKYELDYLIQAFEQQKIPCGRVNDLESLFNGKTAKDLKLVEEKNGKKFIRSPVRTNKDNLSSITEPPKLNSNGEQIMQSLNFSKEDIEEVKKQNRK